MRRVLEKLGKLLRADVEVTSERSQAVLRFCGQMASNPKLEVPPDLEPFLLQLTEFIEVFRHHWNEVKADLPKYKKLFGGPADDGNTAVATGTSPVREHTGG